MPYTFWNRRREGSEGCVHFGAKGSYYYKLLQVTTRRVEQIAEEAKLDQNSLGCKLAGELAIAYVDITMPLREREKLGIKSPEYDRNVETRRVAYQVFEQYMFDTINGRGYRRVLVVCGRRHMEALAERFRAFGAEVRMHDVYDCPWYRGIPLEAVEGIIGYTREDDSDS